MTRPASRSGPQLSSSRGTRRGICAGTGYTLLVDGDQVEGCACSGPGAGGEGVGQGNGPGGVGELLDAGGAGNIAVADGAERDDVDVALGIHPDAAGERGLAGGRVADGLGGRGSSAGSGSEDGDSALSDGVD